MKKLVDIILSQRVFVNLCIPFLAINMLSVVNVCSFTRVGLALFGVWGVLMSLRNLMVCRREPLHARELLLVVFASAVVVSSLFRYSFGGLEAQIRMGFGVLTILAFYFLKVDESCEKWVLWPVLEVVLSVALIVSLTMFFVDYSGTVVGRSGVRGFVGFCENRLFGIFSSANVGGTYAIILTLCSVVGYERRRARKGALALFLAELLIVLSYLTLTLSRGAWVMVFSLFGLMAWRLSACWGRKFLLRVSVAVVAALLAVGVQFPMRHVLVAVRETILMAIVPDAKQSANPPAALVKSEREDIVRRSQEIRSGFSGRIEAKASSQDFTNKRKDIWIAHLNLLKSRCVLGIGYPSLDQYKELQQKKIVSWHDYVYLCYAKGNLHNGYLNVMVHYGVPVFLLLVFFLLTCVRRIIGNILDDTTPLMTYLLSTYVVLIVVNNIHETNIVMMGANFFQGLFWFALGACVFGRHEHGK